MYERTIPLLPNNSYRLEAIKYVDENLKGYSDFFVQRSLNV